MPAHRRARRGALPWAAALAILALAALAPAQAAINQPQPVRLDHGFDEGFAPGADHTIVAGRLDATLLGDAGGWGFRNTTDARVAGVTRACWFGAVPGCAESTEGAIQVVVQDGSGFAVQFGRVVGGELTAAHALGIFADLRQQKVGPYGVETGLVAAFVDGRMAFAPLGAFETVDPAGAGGVQMAGADPASVLEVRRDGVAVATLRGTQQGVTLAGTLSIAPFATEAAIVPFGDGDRAAWSRAEADAAAAGADFSRIQETLALLSGQSGQPSSVQEPEPAMRDLLAGVFASAVLHLPGDSARAREDFGLVRFTALEVAGSGSTLSWSGAAPLQVRGDDVEGAKPLVGFWLLQVPWWSLLLWAAAIGLLVANIVRKSPKKDERWARWSWVGWVAAPLLALLALWLWDLETRAVWGISATSPGLSGQGRAFILLMEVVPLALVGFAIVTPIRMLLRGGLRLAGQPGLGRLVSPLCYPLGFLFGATYLRSYIEVLVRQVMQRVS